MSETAAAPPKDAESYLLEGEEDETEVRLLSMAQSSKPSNPMLSALFRKCRRSG